MYFEGHPGEILDSITHEMSIFVFVVLFEAFHGAFLELARATLRGLLVEIHYEHYHMQAVSIAGIPCKN